LGLLRDDREQPFATALQAVHPLRDQQLLGGDFRLSRFLDTAEQTRLCLQLGNVALKRFLVGRHLAALAIDCGGALIPVGLALAVFLISAKVSSTTLSPAVRSV